MTVTKTAVNDELLGVTIRLIEEFPEVAAGSVMRLVGRVVRSARWTGVPRSCWPWRPSARRGSC